MDFLGPVFIALIGKLDAVTIVLLIIVCACGYYHVVWRREDREDRAKMMETNSKLADALSSLKNVLSAITGKPL